MAGRSLDKTGPFYEESQWDFSKKMRIAIDIEQSGGIIDSLLVAMFCVPNVGNVKPDVVAHRQTITVFKGGSTLDPVLKPY